MSAWRLGTEAAGGGIRVSGDEPAWKQYVSRLTKYIPGDVMVLYTSLITVFLLDNGQLDPQLWLAIVFTAVTPLVIWLAWRLVKTTPKEPLAKSLMLGTMGFVAWSVVVPGTGWQELDFIGDNAGVATVVAALLGLLIPLIAGEDA